MRKMALSCWLLFNLSVPVSQAADSEADRLTAENGKLQLDSLPGDNIDRNGDGRPDLFFQHEGEYLYELVDNNFDGSVDESWKYNRDDVLVSGRVDENFDGILETELVYRDFLLFRVFSDTDRNGVVDLATEFDDGARSFSEKFYYSSEQNQIGRVEFRYGYPSGPEEQRKTELSEKEFQELWRGQQ